MAPRIATLPRSVAWVVAVAAVASVVVALPVFTAPPPGPPPERGALISSLYDPPGARVEWGLIRGDGQLFATHASDPFVRRPDRFRGGEAEQAYRLQRPLYGWLGWAASGGAPAAVAYALVALTVASVAGLVGLVAAVLRRRGADPRLALVLLAAPGVVADLQRVGPEALGTALVVAGGVLWGRQRPRDRWAALALLALAGLCRETLLLVPVGLVLTDLRLAGARLGALVRGALVVAPYAAWVLVLRVGLGAWPEGSVEGRLSVVPFGGLVSSVGEWYAPDVLFVVIALGAAVLAVVRGRDTWLRLVVGLHLVLAATLGAPVWASWLDWGRVLLPMAAFSLLALARGGAPAPDGPARAVDAVGEGRPRPTSSAPAPPASTPAVV